MRLENALLVGSLAVLVAWGAPKAGIVSGQRRTGADPLGDNDVRPLLLGPNGELITGSSSASADRIQGTTEDGVAPLTSEDAPVFVAGRDPATGLLQALQTDSQGGLAITTSESGAGAVAATTPRVTLASDDPAVASLSVLDDWDEANRAAVNAIAGQVGVQGGAGAATALTLRYTQATDDAAAVALADDSIALEAGTATIGTIGAIENALPAGANNIGDVDVLTINGQAPAFGAGAAGATVLRVTQSTDDAGVTSLAALDDLVRGEDSAHATLESGVMMLGVRSDAALTLADTDGDYAPPVLTSLGALRTTAQTERFVDSAGAVFLVANAFTSVATGGALEVEVVPAQGANNSILVLRWIVASTAAANVNFESDDSDAGLGPPIPLAANGGWTSDFQCGWYETADNQALKLQVSASTTVSVHVWYVVR